jgi:type III restriction enzyme
MLRKLDYQDRALSALDDYLAALNAAKANADAVAAFAAANPVVRLDVPDFARDAWKAMADAGKLPAARANIPHDLRKDGIGRPVPNAVLKVPTGGGKTFLAVQSLSRVFGQYLKKNTGFVLWIVPNEAIYAQTLRHLADRQHPYRAVLDRVSAGRVRIFEKTDRLDKRDIDANLCVMLLMLQSANRETNETLRMFRDRGDVHGFVPPEGEQDKHQDLLRLIPNLDAYGGTLMAMVKESLGNALRITRPVVVMDEGHRATSDLAYRTLYGFNPCFVLELTATPKDVQPRGGRNPAPGRYQNVLVEVTGKELDREGMIKMPLNLDPRQGTDWRTTLTAALDKLRELADEAAKLRADTNRYIRPIMLVQVERTGKDQRGAGFIHAEDVREWLKTAGFDDAEIAVKTAETNDLSQPENQDLLSPTNRVRAIITKSALQEGWDCPFAYVLCSLAAQNNLSAMTQLVGRILRQPGAEKTEVPALDECHVITHHAATAEVVDAIKKGLEGDGLGDLVLHVAASDAAPAADATRQINRRAVFNGLDIYLPKVLWIEGGAARELDYETDVLSAIDWRGCNPTTIADSIPENASAVEAQLLRFSLTDDATVPIASEATVASAETLRFDPTYVTRMISDVVQNPFVGREIVTRVVARLAERGFDAARLGKLAGVILDTLRKGLIKEQDSRAEALFRSGVGGGAIQFRLRMDGNNWRMPMTMETTQPQGARQLLKHNGGPLQFSLFAPVFEADFNTDEQNVAIHLDGEAALKWWHRNVARNQYGVQGWRRHRIYPDFIFAVKRSDGSTRIALLETKGDQLDNLDTAYKRGVLNLVSDAFSWDASIPAGQLALVTNAGETVVCNLILMSEVPTKLPLLFQQ